MTVEGESYRRFPILRKLLFPTKAGTLTLPAATFRIAVARQSFFDTGGVVEYRLRKFKRSNHHIFGDFVRATLHHENRIFGARNPQVQIGCVHFCKGWVNDEFAIDASHAHGSNRPTPGNVREHDRG